MQETQNVDNERMGGIIYLQKNEEIRHRSDDLNSSQPFWKSLLSTRVIPFNKGDIAGIKWEWDFHHLSVLTGNFRSRGNLKKNLELLLLELEKLGREKGKGEIYVHTNGYGNRRIKRVLSTNEYYVGFADEGYPLHSLYIKKLKED